MKLLPAILAFAALAHSQTTSKPTTPFEKLKSLAGEWEGSFTEGGKSMTATTSFRLVSGNSTIMNILGGGTPHEMVTMFHMDNADLLATHYCGAQNQPRFRLVPSSEPNVLNFEFKDATNLAKPDAPHMVGVKIVFVDANHHY